MTLKILNSEERAKQKSGTKIVIFGTYGIGKTSLLKTLYDETLCIDLEAGLKSVQDWQGDSISIRTWKEAKDLACFIGGPNPASIHTYSQKHYEYVCNLYGNPEGMDKYRCIFIDSITVASRLCLAWAKTQPEAFSDKTGKPNNMGAYGLLGNEMITWLNQLQHISNKDIIFVGSMEKRVDEFYVESWVPQCEGSKTANELPGIVDEVISMVSSPSEEDPTRRVFVCHTINQWGYPAKDRSGRLNMVEAPHLGNLLKKIKGISVEEER